MYIGCASLLYYGAYIIYTKGGWYSFKGQHYISYEGLRGPITILNIIMGTMFLYVALVKYDSPKENFICSQCENVIESKKGSNIICSKCKIPLENLSGYYERNK